MAYKDSKQLLEKTEPDSFIAYLYDELGDENNRNRIIDAILSKDERKLITNSNCPYEYIRGLIILYKMKKDADIDKKVLGKYKEKYLKHFSKEIEGDIKKFEESIFEFREAHNKDIIEDYVANYGNKSEKCKFPEIEKYEETIKNIEIKICDREYKIKRLERHFDELLQELKELKEENIKIAKNLNSLFRENDKLTEKVQLLEACFNTSLDIYDIDNL